MLNAFISMIPQKMTTFEPCLLNEELCAISDFFTVSKMRLY